jgi:hypothetical protein
MSVTKATYSMIAGAPVNVLDFGADPTGVADSQPAIQAAIDSLSATGGTVFLPIGNYLLNASVILNNKNTRLIGENGSGEGIILSGATILTAAHTSGAVVRISSFGCQIQNLVINSTDTRYASAAGSNYGIWVEAPDEPSKLVTRTYVNYVRVTRQPNHGVLINGRTEASLYMNLFVDNVDGHGFLIDDGSETGRTNKDRAGQINFINCSASRTNGHSIKIGDSSSVDNRPYRIIVNNFEAFFNLQDKTTYTNGYNAYVFGENIEFRGSAFGGTVSDGSSTHGGVYVGGRNITFSNHRFVNNEPYAARVFDIGGTLFNTVGVNFDNLYISNNNQPSGYYNPAISVDSTCQNVRVQGSSNAGLDIVSLMSTNSIYSTIEFEGVKRFNGMQVASFSSVFGGLILEDDESAYYSFGDVAVGTVIISTSTSAGGSVLASFRVGDANAFCDILADAGATVNASTGTLNGTTGADGAFNISADTATNRLYIENRTGGQKAYRATFLSVSTHLISTTLV